MKRTIIISLVIIAVFLTVTILFLIKSDYHGKIGDLKEGNFSLNPLRIDPEAEYPAPPIIYFDDNTNVVGKVNRVDDLKNGQEIKVWVTENEDRKLANKIEVISE